MHKNGASSQMTKSIISYTHVHIIKPLQASAFIAPFLPDNPVIVEAGAFDGTDTLRLAAQWPEGSICAFEPVPEIFEKLVAKTKHASNIHRYPMALSNQTGTAHFYVSEKPEKPGVASQAGSLQAPKERLNKSPLIFPRTISVPTTTLDDWAQHQKISRIDMLWLDMQGHELSVLKSISPALLHTVRVIHCEVGFIEAYEGQPTYPVVAEWLAHHGFTEVARDFENTTDWFFGNIIVVRKDLAN